MTLALDHDTLEDLRTPTGALDDLEVDTNAVACCEPRDAAQLRAFERVDDDGHEAIQGSESAQAPVGPAPRSCERARRHESISAW